MAIASLCLKLDKPDKLVSHHFLNVKQKSHWYEINEYLERTFI